MEQHITKWVTVKGKHVPVLKGETKQDAVKKSISGGTGGGINGKKQVSKKDEVKNMKGPTTSKRK